METMLYLDFNSAIRGDLGCPALLDLGADQEVLMKALRSLSVQGFAVKISRVKKSGLEACDFAVTLTEGQNHDHDMEYLYGTAEEEVQQQVHGHRHLAEIMAIIDEAAMSDRAKEIAGRTFMILAEAEAQAHGLPVEEVHFHEVGAIDSIVDIIAAAVCLDNLNLPQVIVSELYDGQGLVRCQHGVIPVPVPAVANIAANNNLTLHINNLQGEYVTPTGAALAAAMKTSNKLPTEFSIVKIGMGAGKRKTALPGLLRAMIITAEADEQRICKLECNIDDCSGETLGYTMDKLFEAGAKDVHFQPVYMKKNRPGYLLTVICSPNALEHMKEVIFRETTTIGVRHTEMAMTMMSCQRVAITTIYGPATVKICDYQGRERKFYPEYDSVTKICKECQRPYDEVYRMIQKAGEESFKLHSAGESTND